MSDFSKDQTDSDVPAAEQPSSSDGSGDQAPRRRAYWGDAAFHSHGGSALGRVGIPTLRSQRRACVGGRSTRRRSPEPMSGRRIRTASVEPIAIIEHQHRGF